ncbi:hypothetical protein [Nitratireductor sp. ZSWI3]|uniref:hypothetical protein n=1 Tax=Nitratireductor sp. ZSWI3 TaxID=2966359 RepID=UPI0021504109|nr:hypothetical protein [Nitratireductor sp. ZSWI3]MCR4268770.1 hypothetical protein [Nitratireductor sp. ZSWI3]
MVPTDSGFLAAMATTALHAGAGSVTAITAPSTRFRSAEAAAEKTRALASLAGLEHKLSIAERIDDETCRATNILVSGDFIRPATRSIIERLPPRSVIALTHEAWMTVKDEIDIEACIEHGVPVSAVSEAHPLVGGADYQPALCLELFKAAEVGVRGAAVALICDNPLAGPLKNGLRSAGAQMTVFPRADLVVEHGWNAIVLALRPQDEPRLDIRDLGHLAKAAPDATIIQYWGDIDRKAARYFELTVWPSRTPGKGQWGLPLQVLGPEPMLQRIAGALRAAQTVLAGVTPEPGDLAQVLSSSDVSELA